MTIEQVGILVLLASDLKAVLGKGGSYDPAIFVRTACDRYERENTFFNYR